MSVHRVPAQPQTASRHEDERQRGEEIEAEIDEAGEAEADAACDSLSVTPTTVAGVVALLVHARDFDKDGMGFPDHFDRWRLAAGLFGRLRGRYPILATLPDRQSG
jgi:hypothetical protein